MRCVRYAIENGKLLPEDTIYMNVFRKVLFKHTRQSAGPPIDIDCIRIVESDIYAHTRIRWLPT